MRVSLCIRDLRNASRIAGGTGSICCLGDIVDSGGEYQNLRRLMKRDTGGAAADEVEEEEATLEVMSWSLRKSLVMGKRVRWRRVMKKRKRILE